MIAGAAVAAAGAGAGVAWWRSAGRAPAESPVWALRFETPHAEPLSFAALRGQPLLLNFWAPWCPPCVTEMPLLDRFQREHAAAGWRVVGLAVDQREPVLAFLTRLPVAFTIGLAGLEGVELSRSLGNAAGGLPFTVVFDRAGRLAHRHSGAVQPDDLQRWADAVGSAVAAPRTS